MSIYIKRLSAMGFDFSESKAVRDLCEIAVTYARTGTINLCAHGRNYSGVRNLGTKENPLLCEPLAMMKMARLTIERYPGGEVREDALILRADGLIYEEAGKAAIVMIMAQAIKDNPNPAVAKRPAPRVAAVAGRHP